MFVSKARAKGGAEFVQLGLCTSLYTYHSLFMKAVYSVSLSSNSIVSVFGACFASFAEYLSCANKKVSKDSLYSEGRKFHSLVKTMDAILDCNFTNH